MAQAQARMGRVFYREGREAEARRTRTLTIPDASGVRNSTREKARAAQRMAHGELFRGEGLWAKGTLPEWMALLSMG
jgi:hypothetical protein